MSNLNVLCTPVETKCSSHSIPLPNPSAHRSSDTHALSQSRAVGRLQLGTMVKVSPVGILIGRFCIPSWSCYLTMLYTKFPFPFSKTLIVSAIRHLLKSEESTLKSVIGIFDLTFAKVIGRSAKVWYRHQWSVIFKTERKTCKNSMSASMNQHLPKIRFFHLRSNVLLKSYISNCELTFAKVCEEKPTDEKLASSIQGLTLTEVLINNTPLCSICDRTFAKVCGRWIS